MDGTGMIARDEGGVALEFCEKCSVLEFCDNGLTTNVGNEIRSPETVQKYDSEVA